MLRLSQTDLIADLLSKPFWKLGYISLNYLRECPVVVPSMAPYYTPVVANIFLTSNSARHISTNSFETGIALLLRGFPQSTPDFNVLWIYSATFHTIQQWHCYLVLIWWGNSINSCLRRALFWLPIISTRTIELLLFQLFIPWSWRWIIWLN